ncbi:type II toxin-antitoxin system HicA family toxin [Methylocaldum sp. GT1TLB]|uniref:type II toxin-antitoxin system HicA family toxin n=1 Tax=Methylocaldum sp. GT1TLB TaxID=3438965 RepID=UPI003DA1C737
MDAEGLRRSPPDRAGSHERVHPRYRRYTTIPNHPGDTSEGTPQAIFRQAGIEPEIVLKG